MAYSKGIIYKLLNVESKRSILVSCSDRIEATLLDLEIV